MERSDRCGRPRDCVTRRHRDSVSADARDQIAPTRVTRTCSAPQLPLTQASWKTSWFPACDLRRMEGGTVSTRSACAAISYGPSVSLGEPGSCWGRPGRRNSLMMSPSVTSNAANTGLGAPEYLPATWAGVTRRMSSMRASWPMRSRIAGRGLAVLQTLWALMVIDALLTPKASLERLIELWGRLLTVHRDRLDRRRGLPPVGLAVSNCSPGHGIRGLPGSRLAGSQQSITVPVDDEPGQGCFHALTPMRSARRMCGLTSKAVASILCATDGRTEVETDHVDPAPVEVS